MAEAALSSTLSGESWLDRAASRPFLAMLVIVLIGWLPGALILPPLDRDESRFAEAGGWLGRQAMDGYSVTLRADSRSGGARSQTRAFQPKSGTPG
jgi:hypothetical protein